MKEIDYVKEFSLYPESNGKHWRVLKAMLGFGALEDYLSCCGESHSGEVYQRWGDN